MTDCDHDCSTRREAAMVTVAPGIWCDPCIVPLVSALNAAGLKTIASCCGHGRRPTQIILADGREIIVARNFEEARLIDGAFPTINDDLPRSMISQ